MSGVDLEEIRRLWRAGKFRADHLAAMLWALEERRFVYVAEKGCYSERWTVGVYETAEAAMKAAGAEDDVWTRSAGDDFEHWSNNKDWWEYVTVVRMEVPDDDETPDQRASGACRLTCGLNHPHHVN